MTDPAQHILPPTNAETAAGSFETKPSQLLIRLSWTAIAVAVALRIFRYLHGHPLWLDEAYLALNLLNRSVSELVVQLDDDQFAPYGFLLSMKSAVDALGMNEYSLRLLPFLISLVSVYVFYSISKRVLTDAAVPIAVGLFAVSHPLLRYAVEAKKYGYDIGIALGVTFMGVSWATKPSLPLSRAVLFALGGALAIWFSFPSAFVLAAVGITMGALYTARRQYRSLPTLGGVIAVWLVSFGIQYIVMTGGSDPQLPKSDLENLQAHFERDFMPVPPSPGWLISYFGDLARYASSDGVDALFVFATLMGCLGMATRNGRMLAMLLLPLVIMLGVSTTQMYPATGRFATFLVPGLLLIAAAGFEEIRQRGGRHSGVVYALLLTITFVPLTRWAVVDSAQMEGHEDIRPAISYLTAEAQPDDVVFLHWTAIPQYRFYTDDDPLPKNFILGSRSENAEKIEAQLAGLEGHDRVWILVSTGFAAWPEGVYFRGLLDGYGERLDAFEKRQSALYLYDFSSEANATAQ